MAYAIDDSDGNTFFQMGFKNNPAALDYSNDPQVEIIHILPSVWKGRERPEETRKLMSDAAKNRSPEHLAKIGTARKGLEFSDEWRANMSNAHKGVPLSESHKAALRGKRGKQKVPRSPEHSAKLVESRRRNKLMKELANGESH